MKYQSLTTPQIKLHGQSVAGKECMHSCYYIKSLMQFAAALAYTN